MVGLASEIGRALRGARHDLDAAGSARLPCPGSITLQSAAFADGAALPLRYTADGAGVSPPLSWSGVPEGAVALALLVEDVDVPLPRPIVHMILHEISPAQQGLAEGAVAVRGANSRAFAVGRNTYGRQGWLPPSPIPGHGPHRYVFQLIALDAPLLSRRVVGRGALMTWARRHAIGHGQLIGTYERA